MATYSKNILSGSTDGRPILVNQTAIATGLTIHTGPNIATSFDEIWIYAMNTSASTKKLTIGWGGVTDPNDLIEVSLSAEAGLVLIAPGLILKGNATPLTIKAAAADATSINLHGYVNKIV
jgi:dihydroorotate dehydrogenase